MASSRRSPEAKCYAVTAPGLEAVTSAELRGLGFRPSPVEPGGVGFDADAAAVFRANLHLRTASRVLVELARFRATAFHELEQSARAVPWAAFVPEAASVEVRVTCKKSRLYHSDAVAERVLAAVKRAVPTAAVERARGAEDPDATAAVERARGAEDPDATEEAAPAQLLTVRFIHDVCTISADSSGALLHRRGHRLATARAPLRETLAAGVLLALGYDGSAPLVDPMCGSGTFPLEAALIARRIAPGLSRSFACEGWPGADRAAFEAARAAARSSVLPRAPAAIVASDRDDGAVAAARANLERAGVAPDVALTRCALSSVEPPGERGLLVMNPPYGARVGKAAPLRDLYAQVGNVVRARFSRFTVGLLSTDRGLEAHTRLPLEEIARFKNGGIPVRLVKVRGAPT